MCSPSCAWPCAERWSLPLPASAKRATLRDSLLAAPGNCFCWRLACCSRGRTRREHTDGTCCWRGQGLSSKATGCLCCGAAQQPRSPRRASAPPDEDGGAERRWTQACARVRVGELSRTRHMLTAAELAPGDDATWRALTDPAKRPPQLRKSIPAELLTQTPAHKVELGPAAVSAALRGAKQRGGAAGLSGMRAEHLRHQRARTFSVRGHPARQCPNPCCYSPRPGIGSSHRAAKARRRGPGDRNGRRLPSASLARAGSGLGRHVRPSYTPIPVRAQGSGRY